MVMAQSWKICFLFFIFWISSQEPVLANIFVTTPVTIGKDQLEISCFPNNNGILFQEISSIKISKNTTNVSFEDIVRLETNNGTESIEWSDSTIQSRANVSGSISSTRNSRLTVTISPEEVACSDDGVFRCTITGMDLSGSPMVESGEAFLDVKVLPSQINLTAITSNGTSETAGEFTSGSVVQFVCSGVVGDPVLPLYWCIQNGTGQSFVPYFPLDNINQSEPTLFYPCQYMSSSSLTYTVSDTDVTLLCGVGDETSCNSTNALNSSYTVRSTAQTTTEAITTTTTEAEVPSTPNINLVSPVYLRETDVVIACYPENNGILFKDVNTITLSKNITESSYSTVVTVYYDRNFGSVIQWFDASVGQRANASGDISLPRNSRLEMHIGRDQVLCSDEGAYKCTVTGIDILGVVKEENGEAYLDVQANPERPEVTVSSAEYGVSDTIGVFPSSTVLNLTCTAIIGDPPQQLHWCLKNGSVAELILNINQSEVVFVAPCTYSAFSTLIYTVNDNDLDLEFICVVGDGSSCGDLLNDTYTVIAGNPVEPKVDMEAKSPIVEGSESLHILCNPSDNGDAFRKIDRILLSVNRFGNIGFTYIPLVEVQFNSTSGTSQLYWYSTSLETRATFSADVSTPAQSHVDLHINASLVECDDKGRYRCEITGTSMKGKFITVENSSLVELQTLPKQVQINVTGPIVASSEVSAVISPGAMINLTCSGTVGDPPQNITWCYRNGTDQPYVPYPRTDDIAESSLIVQSCQFSLSSILSYTVHKEDFDLSFLCEVGSTSGCESGFIQDTYTIYAGDQVEPRVDMYAFSPVVIDVDNLIVSCTPSSDSGRFMQIIGYLISLNPFGDIGFTFLPKVEVRINTTSGSTEIVWHSATLESRATVTLVTETNGLVLNISSPLCEDQGKYKCEVAGTTLIDSNVVAENSTLIDIQSLPKQAQINVTGQIIAESDVAAVISPGAMINLTCSGTVGDPPQNITWCYRNGTDQPYLPYPHTDDSIQSSPIAQSCQFSLSNVLPYTINKEDFDLSFLCEVGSTSGCGSGLVQDTYTIYAGDQVEPRVDVYASSPVVLDVDNLVVSCTPSTDGGRFKQITGYLISLNPFGDIGFTFLPKVEVRINTTSESQEIVWHGANLESRATLSIMAETNSLVLNISSPLCEDQGKYKCEVAGTTVIDSNIVVENSTVIDIQTLPKQVQINVTGPIVAESEAAAVISPGTMINLTCSGTVGDPPQNITWCYRNGTDQPYLPYPRSDDITQSSPIAQSCQFSLSSKLSYTVNKEDFDLSFLCEVGSTSGCGSGLVQDTYTIYAGDQVEPRVGVFASSPVVISEDHLVVSCIQSTSSGRFKDIIRYFMSLNPFGDIGFTFIPKVEVTINTTSGSKEIVWHSSSLESRATLAILTEQNGLLLNISNSLCEDQGRYKCDVTGTTVFGNNVNVENSTLVDIQSLPKQVQINVTGPIVAESETAAVISPGAMINLTCSGTIGDPPQNITWCYRNGTDQPYVLYPRSDDITQSSPIAQSCQFSLSSTLSYTVNKEDFDLSFLCEVGSTSGCESGLVQDTYTIYAGKQVEPRVDVFASSPVVISEDHLAVSCTQSTSGGRFKDITRYFISMNPFGDIGFTFIPKVEVTINTTSGHKEIIWHSSSLESRATLITLTEQNGLLLNISNPLCEDQGRYKCDVTGTTVFGNNVNVENSTLVDIQSLPKQVQINVTGPIVAESEAAAVISTGAMVNLTCSGTIGDPPQNITWCYQNGTDQPYFPYPRSDDITQFSPITQSCQFSLSSTLQYTVNKEDFDLSFLCEVGSKSGCGSALVQDTYTIYAGDQVEPRVDVFASSPVVISEDHLVISCIQSTSGGRFKDIARYFISLNPFGDIGFTFIPKVEVTLNATSGHKEIFWHSSSLESRATLITLTEQNGLLLNISNPLCEDQGRYKCEVTGTTVFGNKINIENSTLVDIQSMPDGIDPILVESPANVTDNIFPFGTNLNLTCNAGVGDPPNSIRWCIRNLTETNWQELSIGVLQSDPVLTGPCFYNRSSTLSYNLASDVEFLCEVGGGATCNNGYRKEQLNIYIRTTTSDTVSSSMSPTSRSTPSATRTTPYYGVDMYSSATSKGYSLQLGFIKGLFQ